MKPNVMTLSIIVAVAENGIIGCAGRMPWHISEDLRRFKRITSGHPVVMGRKTFESLGCKPLPNRTNIVITRNAGFSVPEGTVIASSLEEAVAQYQDTAEEVFIIGGGEVYRQAMASGTIDKLYLTRILASPEGDTSFPEIKPEEWRMVWCEAHPGAGDVPPFEFVDYIRIKR